MLTIKIIYRFETTESNFGPVDIKNCKWVHSLCMYKYYLLDSDKNG